MKRPGQVDFVESFVAEQDGGITDIALLTSPRCGVPPNERPGQGELIRAALAEPAERARRSAAMRSSWLDREQRRRRRTAIARAMRDPALRARLAEKARSKSNSPLIARAINDLNRAAQQSSRTRLIDDRGISSQATHAFALAAYAASLAASAIELGCKLPRLDRGNGRVKERRAAAFAAYLTVTAFGVPRRVLAEARNYDRRRLRKIVNRIEAEREDGGLLDAMLGRIEARLA